MRQMLIWRGLQVIEKMERETGFEPATSSLGSWHSTTELLPHSAFKSPLTQATAISNPERIRNIWPPVQNSLPSRRPIQPQIYHRAFSTGFHSRQPGLMLDKQNSNANPRESKAHNPFPSSAQLYWIE